MESDETTPQESPPAAAWFTSLDPRTQKHVEFARSYAADFNHGAPGHLDLLTIAQLADKLDEAVKINISGWHWR